MDQLSCPHCGFTTTATTPARASYALRVHSCARQRKLAAIRAETYRRRHGTPRRCRHKMATHVHGTNACYHLDRCRCNACWRASRAYDNARNRSIAYGRWAPLVDAEPARVHVRTLMAAHLGPKRIAELSGVPHGAISKLVYGDYGRKTAPSRRIRAATEAKLLAVHADASTLGARKPVAVLGTRRRLQALVWVGWSQTELARRLGVTLNVVNKAVNGRYGDDVIGAGTARKTAALFDQLWDTPPPADTPRQRATAARARALAVANDWKSPAWWDSDLIDDPLGFDPTELAAAQ